MKTDMIKQKHQQLSDLLETELTGGTYSQREKLPSMRELAVKYNVSINVVTQAIESLKKKRLVSVKVGDGIYSNVSKPQNPIEYKFSGERLFAQYQRAKILNVLIEDKEDWQLEFWNATFDSFVKNNLDIELSVNYFSSPGRDLANYDLYIGGFEFLNKSGICFDNLMNDRLIADFQVGLYENKLLNTNDLRWQGDCRYYPLCFKIPQLLSREQKEAAEGEDLLTFVERMVAESNGKPVGYKVLNILSLLVNAGCLFVNYEQGCFMIQDHDNCLQIFKRIKKLYKHKDILIMHGQFIDLENILVQDKKRQVMFVEMNYPVEAHAEPGKEMFEVPYPCRDNLLYTPIVAAINAGIVFPEEALRLIAYMISPEIQKQIHMHKIAIPIDKAIMHEIGKGKLLQKIQSCRKFFYSAPSINIMNIINYFLIWEFYYYLNDRVGEDVLSRIEKKNEYYLLQKNK
jgi:DNA-binding transcriptional regulator YhcF (GntR family)